MMKLYMLILYELKINSQSCFYLFEKKKKKKRALEKTIQILKQISFKKD